jgi:SOS-response transcriptional repressor LexA/DNA-binding transcriptional regulator YdaS (Cro superfamily)
MITFRQAVRKRLKKLGMGQNVLAETLGVTPSHVSQVLSGKTAPPLPGRSPFIEKLESALQCDKGELLSLAVGERYRRDMSKAYGKYEGHLQPRNVHFLSLPSREEKQPMRESNERERCAAQAETGLSGEMPGAIFEEGNSGHGAAPKGYAVPYSNERGPCDIPLLSRKQVLRKVFSRRRAIRREVTNFLTSWADRTVEGLYALTVWDDSMAPKFERGDRIIVDPKAPSKRSDVVVCCTKNKDVLIGRMITRDEVIVLESLNPSFQAVTLRSKEVKFSHKVVEVIFKE